MVQQQQFPASDFVESSGAIPFLLSKRQVYLIHHTKKDQWLFAKGRRNINESHREAAIREVREETGLHCKLLPVTMETRASANHEPNDVRDKARVYPDLIEPFMCTVRNLSEGIKLIFWYIAVVDEDDLSPPEGGESSYQVSSFSYEEAVEKLSYIMDRDILKRAVEIVEQSYPSEMR